MISDKKVKFFFLYFLIFFILLLPLKSVDAVAGVADIGVFDLAAIQLDALDFIDSVILRLVVFVFLLIVESEVFIITAAILLQWAINLPIHLDNILVNSGWAFTSGLVNLFFILIFVVIALAYILKLETFEIKKALPRLIIIALVINFSLVFIGALTDIADIFRNSILNAIGGDVVSLAIEPLKTSAKSIAVWFFAIPITYLITALIPYANVAAIVTIGGLIITDIFAGGILLQGLFLIVLNFVIGSIFFLYFIFFLMRIGIIWVLAILAPLAFFAYILPQTKKYWTEWFTHLLEWLMVGILVLFLAGLGLKLFAITGDRALFDWGGDIDTGRGTVPVFIYNYLFLLIYLGIVFYLSKKYTPSLAKVLMDYGGSFGRGVGKIATSKSMRKDVWGPLAEKFGKTEEWGKRLEETAEKRKEEGKRGATLMGWASRATRGVGRGVGVVTKPFKPQLIEYAAMQRRVAAPKGWDQMTDSDKVAYIDSLARDGEKLVLTSKMKGEGSFQRTDKEKFQKSMVELVKKFAKDTPLRELYKKEIGDVFDALPDKVTEKALLDLKSDKKEKERAQEQINKIMEEYRLDTEKEADRDKAAGVLHARGLKPADVVKVAKDSLKSEVFRLATHRMNPAHLRELSDTFDRKTVEDIFEGKGGLNTIINSRKDLENFYRENRRLARFFILNPIGRELGWKGVEFMPKTKEGRPHPGALEKWSKIGTILEKEPRLSRFDESIPKMKALGREIKKLEETHKTETRSKIKTELEAEIKETNEAWRELREARKAILADRELKEKLKEIEELREEVKGLEAEKP